MNNCKAKNSELVYPDDRFFLQKFILQEFSGKMMEKMRSNERKPANKERAMYKLHNENVKKERKLYIIFQSRRDNLMLHTAFSRTKQKKWFCTWQQLAKNTSVFKTRTIFGYLPWVCQPWELEFEKDMRYRIQDIS